MERRIKLKCGCEGDIKKAITNINDIETEVMICSRCSFITLTKEQAKDYLYLLSLNSKNYFQ